MKPAWRDLRRGDVIYASTGERAGEVVHTSEGQVVVQLAQFRGPTFLKGPCLRSNVARLGQMMIFTSKNR